MVIIYTGMVYAQIFMGGCCCFPEGWHAPALPINSSTDNRSYVDLSIAIYKITNKANVNDTSLYTQSTE